MSIKNICIHFCYFSANCNCDSMESVPQEIVTNSAKFITQALVDMKNANNLPLLAWDCESPNGDNATREAFDLAVGTVVNNTSTYLFKRDKHNVPLITAPIEMAVSIKNTSKNIDVGNWTPQTRFVQLPTYTKKNVKRFFRVGNLENNTY